MKTVTVLVGLALCVGSVFGRAWNKANNPLTWNPLFELELGKLPTSGQIAGSPWSDTYWPSFEGGIAKRWQDSKSNYPGFNYHLHSLQELKNGTVDLNTLSPAEKFDLYQARYDYPLTRSEWRRCSPSDATWEGICHGWAPASIHYSEPNVTKLNNSDGIEIPFKSSDIKALLSYFLAQYGSAHDKTWFIAERCNKDIDQFPSKADDRECWDINPGSFHVVITNLIGLGRAGFVGDVDRSYAVWNQPISEYQCTLGPLSEPTNSSTPGTVKEQPVKLTMFYVKETSPYPTAHKPLILQKKYNYTLHLDANDTILGGEFAPDQWDRVDFLWATEPPAFFGYFAPLKTVYEASLSTPQMRIAPRRMVTLGDYHAVPVTSGHINFAAYEEGSRRSWFVRASRTGEPLRLQFTSFFTRRFSDFVRVFEVSQDGQIGALVAVLHGSRLPDDIVVRPGMSVLVTFSVDEKATSEKSLLPNRGFNLQVL